MSIIFQEEKGLLTLHTKHSTYQMAVDRFGVLRHLYYGRRADGTEFYYPYTEYDISFSAVPPRTETDGFFSFDTCPQEYTTCGVGDYRPASIGVVNPDGSFCADFRYVSHRVLPGKYAIPGMPASHAAEGEAETLEIVLRDEVTDLSVVLRYGVFFENDVIARSAEIVNGSKGKTVLTRAFSMCLDFPYGKWDLLHFHGRHCLERQAERMPLGYTKQVLSSGRGHTSHHENNFCILCDENASEDHGECYGFMLVYSGNFKTEIERTQLNAVRIVSGINDDNFRWTLESGESFHTPEVLLSFSGGGLTALSHQYHEMIRSHICRGKFAKARRPVLINNWEATMFDFTTDKVIEIARQGAELGCELFVLDDGWFGARDSDHAGLGDWFVNERKMPGGLMPLIEAVQSFGMKFGIWIEPEMINEDSDLFRKHPDWALAVPGREPVRGRHQLVLDMTRKDVRNYLFDCFSALIANHPISYIKWDMNRCIAEVFSAELPPERQGEVFHRFTLGFYDLIGRLTESFPDVLFEGCSGGGGRYDAGAMYYTPQIWLSDDTDAIERVKIQYGSSFGYPVSTMGAHVSVAPNQQTGKNTPLHTRGIVAMSGTFGYEMDLNLLSEEEKEEVRQQIRTFKEHYWLIQDGLYYRLTDVVHNTAYAAWMFAAKDGSEALVNLVVTHVRPNYVPMHVRLKGLIPEAKYREEVEGTEGRVYTGAALMYGGYTFPALWADYPSCQVHFTRID